MRKTSVIWYVAFLAILCTGCTSIVKAEQPAILDAVVLDESHSIGQTFRAKFDGMDGIEIYLEPMETGIGEIELILRDSPLGEELGRGSQPMEDITAPGFYYFPLPIQVDSNQEDFYFLLKAKGAGIFKVGSAPGNYYLDGALYLNGSPDDQHQTSFQLSYYAPRLALGLAGEIFLWGWYLLVAGFLFVLPGWALLSWFWPRSINESVEISFIRQELQNFWVKLAVSVGISLSIYPILFLWTDLMGLHLGPWYAWLPPLVGFLILVLKLYRQRKNGEKFSIKIPKIKVEDLVLLAVLSLIVGTRFWAIRSIPLPMWGDSYHHTMITQLIIDNNGLFTSWEPYAEAITFTYHFGFHAFVSVFEWATNLSSAQATMIVGQIINIMAVVVLYPLALLIFKNKWSGIVALVVAGLLSPMPMFYVNWGRYTQLAGQVLLLITIWFTWIIFKTKQGNRKLLILSWLLISSLALTHYRVIIFYLMFVCAFLLLNLRKNSTIHIIKNTFWLGLGAGLIFLPWFVNVFAGQILNLFKAFITRMPGTGKASSLQANMNTYSLGDLTFYLPLILWLMMIILIAIALWQQKKGVAIISLWWFFLLLIANPHWLNLPGKGIIDNFSIFIAIYILAGLIFAIIPKWWLVPEKTDSLRKWQFISLVLLLSFISFWGAWQRYREAAPNTFALATASDLRAAEWIRDNVSKDSKFLVNAFFAYDDSVMVGSDGGWWLPLIADRQTTLPPMTYGFEEEPLDGYNKWVQVPTRMIETNGLTHPETLSTFANYGVTHIYIGQQQGSVNYAGPLRLEPSTLEIDPHFQTIYHQDRVWIFEFKP